MSAATERPFADELDIGPNDQVPSLQINALDRWRRWRRRLQLCAVAALVTRKRDAIRETIAVVGRILRIGRAVTINGDL